jgi:hypothetical protein
LQSYMQSHKRLVPLLFIELTAKNAESAKKKNVKVKNFVFFANFAVQNLFGDLTGGETPVPIPNTEVKPTRADGTHLYADRESRSLPRLIMKGRQAEMLRRPFLFFALQNFIFRQFGSIIAKDLFHRLALKYQIKKTAFKASIQMEGEACASEGLIQPTKADPTRILESKVETNGIPRKLRNLHWMVLRMI